MEKVMKITHRNKCDYCDDLAVYKLKKNKGDPYSYLCKSCYTEKIIKK